MGMPVISVFSNMYSKWLSHCYIRIIDRSSRSTKELDQIVAFLCSFQDLGGRRNNLQYTMSMTRDRLGVLQASALKTRSVFPDRFFKAGESRSAKCFQKRSASRVVQPTQISWLILNVLWEFSVRVDLPQYCQNIVPIEWVCEGQYPLILHVWI